MTVMSLIFIALSSFAANPPSQVDKLIGLVGNDKVQEFQKNKTQLSLDEANSLLERVLASSNPAFLEHTLVFQKEGIPALKKNIDLAEIAITDSSMETLKELDKHLPLDTITLSDGRNLLHAAVSAGTIEQIDWILSKYPKMVLQLDKQNENPLSAAARRGDPKTIEALFRGKTTPVSVKNKKGRTPVEIATLETFTKSAALIEKLLKKKK